MSFSFPFQWIRSYCDATSKAVYRLLLLSFLILVPALAAAEPEVSGIRMNSDANSARFVIDLDEEVEFTLLTLADPYRVVIDLPEVNFSFNSTGSGEGEGLIDRYRFGLFRAGVSRIVLDLSGPAEIERMFMLSPGGGHRFRLVLDMKPTSRDAFLASVQRAVRSGANIPDSRVSAPITARPANSRRVIIIDAGHGGIDPGNLGIIGVPEKTIALNIARAIRDQLARNPDYEVVMTRDRDIFIPLDRRRVIAREQRADMFISVHADSFRQAGVGGATVYSLSERASDREAAALARRENRSDLIAGIDLTGESDEVTSILVDLAQRETMNYSARLANLVVGEMRGDVTLRTNSHRFAGLVVLKAPDVPSILLEAGYLTNRADARFMNSSAGRSKIAAAIRRAVDGYFNTLASEGF
jgi:N-acetylmuramoyl-L-alanine amidase